MAADTAQPDSLGVRLCARLHVQTWVGSRSFSWADCTRLPQETVASRAFEQCCIQPDPTASRVLQRGGCLQPLRAQPAPHRPGFILFPSSPRGTFQVSSLGNSSLKGNSSFTGGEGGGQGQPHMGPGPAPYQDSRAAGKRSCLHSVSRSPFARCDVLCAESKQRPLSPSPRGSCPSLLRDSLQPSAASTAGSRLEPTSRMLQCFAA